MLESESVSLTRISQSISTWQHRIVMGFSDFMFPGDTAIISRWYWSHLPGLHQRRVSDVLLICKNLLLLQASEVETPTNNTCSCGKQWLGAFKFSYYQWWQHSCIRQCSQTTQNTACALNRSRQVLEVCFKCFLVITLTIQMTGFMKTSRTPWAINSIHGWW